VELNKSLSDKFWNEKKINFNLVEKLAQNKSISLLFSKLLVARGINEDNFDQFINPDILENLPNPFYLKDMNKAVNRCIQALQQNEKIGIISDYDVDGSTSFSILYKFLNNFTSNIIFKTPDRLSEGYGPNNRLMNEMLKENVKLLFTLDCGTSAFNTLDHPNYKKIEVIVIDHHLSEFKLPKVHSIINPNRYDEDNNFKDFAAVGVTFLFLMALRKQIRELNIFSKVDEPNLMSFLDLVAVGTICDIVNIQNYNRAIVKKGLELILKRYNKILSKIIDNSKITNTPSARDIGFTVGPQINAASRIEDSSFASKLLITNDENEIESGSRKLFLINEKRKLIEQKIFDEAIEQVHKQKNNKFIVVYKNNWHHGVLGIVASRIVHLYNKPTFVLSFNNNIGVGSGRSIDKIDIGNIIIELKNNNLIDEGGGHKMAVGLKINIGKLDKFLMFIENKLSSYDDSFFEKILYYDSQLSVNQINNTFLDTLDQMEPYGKGNEEPLFLIKDIIIEKVKIIKNKHLLIFFKNDLGKNLKGISFNCFNSPVGDYLRNYHKYRFEFLCTIKKDNYSNNLAPQIQISDVKVTN
tara:strand:+ start:86 stop:1831 length:1746 start_codon:yes stop_codon:yes gene_type:complete